MINITIDGHSGSGKSSTAKKVAKALGFTYIDTGAMYRAVTWAVLKSQKSRISDTELEELLNSIHIRFKRVSDGSVHTFLNGEDVELMIRSIEVASKVSEVSSRRVVRAKLVEWQREMARKKGVVMEGRDIGTVILPDAELKIFMTASLEIRAQRRWEEMKNLGEDISIEEVMDNLVHRDRLDSTREVAPLKKADGAIEIDTSKLSLEEQIEKIVELARLRINNLQ